MYVTASSPMNSGSHLRALGVLDGVFGGIQRSLGVSGLQALFAINVGSASVLAVYPGDGAASLGDASSSTEGVALRLAQLVPSLFADAPSTAFSPFFGALPSSPANSNALNCTFSFVVSRLPTLFLMQSIEPVGGPTLTPLLGFGIGSCVAIVVVLQLFRHLCMRDIFLSHAWNPKSRRQEALSFEVDRFFREKRGYRVWFDNEDMGHDLDCSMCCGILRSGCVVALISENYAKSENCKKELRWAQLFCKPVVACRVESDPGWLPREGTELFELLGRNKKNMPHLTLNAINWEVSLDKLLRFVRWVSIWTYICPICLSICCCCRGRENAPPLPATNHSSHEGGSLGYFFGKREGPTRVLNRTLP